MLVRVNTKKYHILSTQFLLQWVDWLPDGSRAQLPTTHCLSRRFIRSAGTGRACSWVTVRCRRKPKGLANGGSIGLLTTGPLTSQPEHCCFVLPGRAAAAAERPARRCGAAGHNVSARVTCLAQRCWVCCFPTRTPGIAKNTRVCSRWITYSCTALYVVRHSASG